MRLHVRYIETEHFTCTLLQRVET